MPIGMIVGGIGELFIDLFATDEADARAAKIALWTGVGGASAGLDLGVSAVVGAGVMAATNAVAAGVQSEGGTAVVDTFGSILAGGLESNLMLLKQTAGAGAGAAIGGAAGGEGGALEGMSLGSSVMSGSAVENVAKLGAASAGGAIGLAATDGSAEGFTLGFGVGTAVGGAGATQLGAAPEVDTRSIDAGLDALEQRGFAPDALGQAGKIAEASLRDQTRELAESMASAKTSALFTLAGEAAAPLVAMALHGGDRDAEVVEAWSAMRGVTGGAGAAIDATVRAAHAPTTSAPGERLERAAAPLAAAAGAAGAAVAYAAEAHARERERAGAEDAERAREAARVAALASGLPRELLRAVGELPDAIAARRGKRV